MRIKTLWIKNYRAIESLQIDLKECTALLGENNAGKSACMSALALFFHPSPKLVQDDFRNRDVHKNVQIIVEFSDLTPAEKSRFEGNLIDGTLRVARTLSIVDPSLNGRFFVAAKVNSDFSKCRSIDKASEKRRVYAELQEKYPALAKVTAADQIDAQLEIWEASNPDALELDYVAGFRGFKNVAAGQLREKTDLVYVPAVKDAADAIRNEKSSPVKQLLNTIAKQTIENNDEFKKFKSQADETLRELTSPDNVPQLTKISERLTNILSRYYSGSALNATWEPVSELPISYPKSDISVMDNGFESPIENVGHGLQRAILLTVLEYMAHDRAQDTVTAESSEKFSEAQSDIILLIEEPEIFQHPIKQRLFREAFNSICDGFNKTTGIRVQIVFTTHSPLLISIHDFDSLGVLRRAPECEGSVVRISQASLSKCAETTAQAMDVESNLELYKRSLHIFTPEIAEGFFAKKVVLVEGTGDLAVINGFYKRHDRDPLSEGIHVVQTNGKTNFDKPRTIFDVLEIPVFFVFDNDRGNNKDSDRNYNRLLQKLCGEDKTTDWPNGCYKNFAAFDGKLEKYVKDTVGEDYFDRKCSQVADLHNIKPSETLKNPTAASIIFGIFLDDGHEFPVLNEIVAAVDSL